jgi:hypothetical protein
MKVEYYITPKNGFSIVVGVCVVLLAVIPLKVPPEHLLWFRWESAVLLLAIVAVGALLYQAHLQSKDDHEQAERNKRIDKSLSLMSAPSNPISKASLDDLDDETVESLMGGWNAAKRAGMQAGMLWRFGAEARTLVDELEKVWHRWNYAKECLVHPLDGSMDHPDFANIDLVNERRDFMARYTSHLGNLHAEFPGFLSDIAQLEYPSKREYVDVLSRLRTHAESLEQRAERLWNSESPDESLRPKQP